MIFVLTFVLISCLKYNFTKLKETLSLAGWDSRPPLLSESLIYTLDADSITNQPALNKKKGEEVDGMGVREREPAGQSWEWGETEHSVCCVYEGRTWHKHWLVCKSILCCSLLHACLLNTVFVLSLCTATLRIHTQQHLALATLCLPCFNTGEGRTDRTM